MHIRSNMKKRKHKSKTIFIVVTMIVIFLSASMSYVNVPEMMENQRWEGYIHFLMSYNKNNSSIKKKCYSSAIIKYTRKYKLPDAEYIARQILLESAFDERAIGQDGELGCSQLKPRFHSWLIPSMEHYTNTLPILDQMTNLFIGVEAQCWLMSNFYHRHKDYNKALICYWKGEFSDNFRDYTNNKWFFTNTIYFERVINKSNCDARIAMFTNMSKK